MNRPHPWRCSLVALTLGCGPSADDIVKNLASDNPVVREDSAKIAKNSSGDDVIKALVQALDDPSERVQLLAVESLAELEAKDAVPALVAVVEGDHTDSVKREAVDALGRLGDPRAVPVLMVYVASSADDKPPLNGIWALGNIGDMAALPLLAKLRLHADPYVAWNATEALRNLRP